MADFSLWLLLVLILLFLYSCYKSQKLGLLAFLCMLLIGMRTWVYTNQLTETSQTFRKEPVSLQSDSIKIDGNLLKAIGEIKGKKYLIYYSLQTKAEKTAWQDNIIGQGFVSGKTQTFSPARNLQGFDERKYYHSLGISQSLQADELQQGKKTKMQLRNLRTALLFRIDQKYTRHLASYLKALTLGYKDSQFEEYSTAYRATGLLHLFTLSGMHIQFYLGGCHLLLKRLRLTPAPRFVLLTGLGVLLLVLTGGSFSTIRAVLSYLLVFCCLYFGLLVSTLDQWSIVLFLLFLGFPLVLNAVGGQLSLYFSLLLVYLQDVKRPSWQRAGLFSLLSLPILLYHFGKWRISGGLLTLLLFPLFEGFILPSCLLLLVGCFLPLPSFFSDFIDQGFRLLEAGLKMVGANWVFGKPTLGVFIGLGILVLLVLDRIKYQRKSYLYWVLTSVLLLTTTFSPQGMVAFVDVGQGDCIFIKLPFKQETFLIDTGGRLRFKQAHWQQRQAKQLSDYNLLPLLKAVGCSKIDHLLITHNDTDHMGELSHVLNEVKVKNLYLAKGSQWELQKLLKPLKQTSIHLIKRGDSVGRKLKIAILAPETSQGENDDSLVTYFQIHDQRFLLTGDLEQTGEIALLNQYPQLKTDFLKVGHHGSNTSTGQAFVEQLQPKYAIISVGRTNRYGHPTAETLQQLTKVRAKIFRTDQQGMIYYQWDPLTKRGRIKVLIDFPSKSW